MARVSCPWEKEWLNGANSVRWAEFWISAAQVLTSLASISSHQFV